jgi:hypothetical protein
MLDDKGDDDADETNMFSLKYHQGVIHKILPAYYILVQMLRKTFRLAQYLNNI